MKKSLLLLLMSLCSPLFMFAAVGDNFTVPTQEGYDMVFTILDESAKTCQVGYLDSDGNQTAVDPEIVEGPLTIPETANGYTVVQIGKWAFQGVYRMTSVTIPNTVTAIDDYAFVFCYGLSFLKIPASVTAIGEYAFEQIPGLTLQVERTTPFEISEYAFQDLYNAILRVPEGSKEAYAEATGWNSFSMILEGKQGETFTARTDEGYELVFAILNESAKTCQVGYLNGEWDKTAVVDRDAVKGPLTIPAEANGYTVVQIGKYAFNNLNEMTSVSIPETVTSIDDFAFWFCSGLTSFELPASVTHVGEGALVAFGNVTSVTVAEANPNYDSRDNCNAIIETATNKLLLGSKLTTIPNSVTSIGEHAFESLFDYSLTIPSSVNAIGDYAFGGGNLTLQVEQATPLDISEEVFSNLWNSALRVPEGCRDAYASATGWNRFEAIFEGNEGATFTAQTPEGIDMVFAILDDKAKTCQVGYLNGYWEKMAVDRDAIKGPLTIPATVTNPATAEDYTVVQIGKYVFNSFHEMTSVTIPNTVTTIDEGAFQYCGGLSSLEIPASVTAIGMYAFSGLSNTTSITVAEGNTTYDSRDNCNAIIETATEKLLFGCKATTIPASVTTIGERAFEFYDYTLAIPSTITTIDDRAFIGGYVTLQVDRTTPLEINESVFDLWGSTLRVPEGCKDAYASATGWNRFETIFAGSEGATFIAQTDEGYDMVFAILDEKAKTCQVGYLDANGDKRAVDPEIVEGSLTIPAEADGYTVVKIGVCALQNIYKMTSVTIPNTVTTIEESAFIACNGLTSLEIPASVTSIGDRAFAGLSRATSITVAAGNTIYDSRDNCNAIIETATDKLLVGCQTTTIPASVKEIGEGSFVDLYNYSLSLPSSITTIGDYAFGGNKLTLQVESATPLEINESVFQNLWESTLRVPVGSKDVYTEAPGWNGFETILEGNEGASFTAQTDEGIDMVFTVLDDTEKTCKVGYFNADWSTPAVDRDIVDGSLTIPEKVNAFTNAYTVVKIGKAAFGDCRMTSLTIPNTVTAIEDEAIANCGELTSLEIPASVTTIGWHAFFGLSNAKSITVAEGNPNFDSRDNCNAIIETATNKLLFGCKATTIPASVTEIGENAFTNMWGYTLTIPSTITAIGDYAFTGGNLTLKVEHTTPLDISEYVFEDLWESALRVPTGSKDAYAEAPGWSRFGRILEGNTGVTFTDQTVEGINMLFTVLDDTEKTCQVGYLDGGWDRMAVDPGIKGSVTIPETADGYTVVKIGNWAFENVSGMTSVTIPNTVTTIDEAAFIFCNGLTSLELPASVTFIGERAFEGLSNATSITVAEGNPNYDSRDNCNAIIETATNKLLFGCKATTIPASVTEIGGGAFASMWDYTLTIPSTITAIDDYAFSNTSNLTLQVEHITPLVISEDVFQVYQSTLRVPEGCKDAYASATGWKDFDMILDGDAGATFTVQTPEGYDMLFTILDKSAKTCQVGYLDGGWDRTAIDRDIEGPVTIPETVGEGYTVVKIGNGAFYNVWGMTSVTIPNTVTAIEESAFIFCNGLTSLEIPASVTTIGQLAFEGLTNATSITVAEGNPTFDSRDNCNAIIETATNKLVVGCRNTIIPATVTGIGEASFVDLYNYSLSLPATITTIEQYAFGGGNVALQVESSTPAEISEWAFNNLRNSTLRVPTGSKAAYAEAPGWNRFDNIFEGNEGTTFFAQTAEGYDMAFTVLDDTEKTCQVGYLDGGWDKTAIDKSTYGSVTIPATANGYTVVKIGRCAFNNVYNMTSVTIPNIVTVIDEYAFNSCWSLTSFDLPASVTTIGYGALSGLTQITSVTVAEGNPNYDSRDNCNAIIETATNKLLLGCNNTTIPSGIQEIGNEAFCNVNDCTFTLPSTVTTMGYNAFTGYNLLVQVDRTTPLEIYDDVFQDLSNSILRVPEGCKAAYAEAPGWNRFETILEGNAGATFIAQTPEGYDMVFTILDDKAKTCQVGYINGAWNRTAVDKELVAGPLTIPATANGYTVVKIGNSAFNSVYGMTSVTIPNAVTSIDANAFAYCSGLTSFELPASVTAIGGYAFSGLSNATSLTVASGNPRYDSRDNCNAIIETATNKLLFGCKATTILASVTGIGEGSFVALDYLSLSLPATITEIDSYAFTSNFLTLEVDRTTPLEINDWAFQNIWNSILRVPEGCKAAYAEAPGWERFDSSWDGNMILEGNENATFTAQTAEGIDMAFTVLDEEAKTCQVGYLNGMFDHTAINKWTYGSVTIPEIANGYTVVKIGKWALYNISNMTSVSIPSTVEVIDEWAIASCYALTYCNLPASVETIGEYAVSGLSDFILQVERTEPLQISADVFNNLRNSTLRVPKGCKAAYAAAPGWNKFDKIVDGNEGSTFTAKTIEGIDMVFTILDDEAKTCQVGYLDGNWGKTAVDIEAVNGTVTIPETADGYTVVQIGKYAFNSISRMSSVTIPNTVTVIDEYAFALCDGLTSLELPASVVGMGMYAFEGLNSATSITVATGNPFFDSRDNCNAIIETAANRLLYGCTATTIPATVTEIANASFMGMRNYSLSLPASVAMIENYAFSDNTNLTLTVEATTPLEIGEWVFLDLKNSTLRVPEGCKAAYAEATGWKNFGEIIEMVAPKISLDKKKATIEKGKTLTLTATLTPSDLTDKNVTWKSSDTSVATVSKTGKVTGVKAGTATITATYDATGVEASCKVTISYVKLEQTEVYLEKDKTVTLKATVYPSSLSDRSVTWESSDTKIATVSTAGKVKGVKAGTATITATSKETGLKATCTVTVGYVKLDKTKVDLEKDKTVTLTATVYPSSLSDRSVTWESSDTKIATVSTAGKVKGVKAGTATITATSKETGLKATCTVTVGYVKLDKTKVDLEKDKTVTLTATVYPSSLSDRSVTWESSDTKIATVSTAGKVKGVKAGTATITATSKATGLTATCEVTVGYVKLDKTEASVEKGKTVTLTATVYPSSLTDKTVTWKSSDTKIATVSTAGKVKGVKAGTATITCTSNATGLTATCEVTVGYVKLDKTEATVEKGKTVTLKATVYPSKADQTVTWKSSDTKIATVSTAGKVKGVKAGTATITCTSKATGLKTTCEVTVGYVKLDKTEATVDKGKTVTLKATVYPSSLTDRTVTWKSSNTKIATVTSAGKVKGVKAGTVTITATSKATGLKATCTVTVEDGKVTLDKTEVRIQKGKTVTLKATVTPSSLKDKSVTWKSSNTKIATVTSAGKVKGIKAGTATITCTSNATGKSATCTVTVLQSMVSLPFNDDELMEDEMDNPGAEEPFDVYDLNGRKVKSQVTSLDGLPRGIYIINGKKVMKQ